MSPLAQKVAEPVQATRFPNPARWVLASVFITNLGNGMHTLTVGKLFYDHTGSSLAFGIVIIAEYVISFLLQLLAGPFVDRGNPKTTSVYSDLARGLFICTASFMLSSAYTLWWVVASVIVIDIAKPFYVSATFALGPALVPDESLIKYNSRSTFLIQTGQLLGTALAGLIIQKYGISIPFILNGFSFLLAAFAVWVAKIDPIERKKASYMDSWIRGFVDDWKEIGCVLCSNRALSWHIILCAGDFLVVSWINLSLVPLVNTFGGNTYWLSVFDGCFAIGALIAAGFAGKIINKLEIRNAAVLGIGGEAILFVFLSVAHIPFLIAAIMIAIGALNAYSATIFYSYLQRRSRGPIKGRISAVRYLVLSILAGVFIPVISFTQNTSLKYGFWTIAAICASFSILTFVLGRSHIFGNALLGSGSVSSLQTAGEEERQIALEQAITRYQMILQGYIQESASREYVANQRTQILVSGASQDHQTEEITQRLPRLGGKRTNKTVSSLEYVDNQDEITQRLPRLGGKL